jgi:ABC-2 type transport system permease protein
MSSFFAGFRFETKILLREPIVWFTIITLFSLTLFSLYNGAVRVKIQQDILSAAQSDTSKRIDGQKNLLARMEKGDVHEDLPPYRDPRNVVFVGSNGGQAAFLKPEPLALVAVGLSDIFPQLLKVTTASKDTFLFSDEIENPSNLLSGSIDLAFVIVFVLPIVILALCFNLISSEREQGTLAMTLAAAHRPLALIFGKIIARALLPIFTITVATTIGLFLFSNKYTLVMTDYLLLCASILLYSTFWVALAAAIDGLGKNSAFNALTLLGVWVIITILTPAGINALAEYIYPAPSRIDMTLAARAASTDADKEKDAVFARYKEEHPEAKRDRSKEASLRRLASQEAAFIQVESIIKQHDLQLERQQEFTNKLDFLSPALLTYQAIVEIAGTGTTRYRGFLDDINSFHVKWRDFFLARAKTGASLTIEDYNSLPKFVSLTHAPINIIPPLLGILIPTLFAAVIAFISLKRCAP